MGYTIRQGRPVVNRPEAEILIRFFRLYASSVPLLSSVEQSGLPRTPQVCKSFLSNRKYRGDGFYPPIIPPELWDQTQEELQRRADGRAPTVKKRRIPEIPVQTRFRFCGETKGLDPSAIYAMIVEIQPCPAM